MDFSVGTGRNGGLPETADRYFLTTPKHGKADFFMAHTSASGNQAVTGIRLSTNGIAPQERQSWLREVICREYAHVSAWNFKMGYLKQQNRIDNKHRINC